MEAREVWAQLAPSAALLISLGALGVSWAAYRLAKARDAREIERERPAVAITMPRCEGVGPWTVEYSIRNRGEDPIILVGIRMPVSIGRTAVTTRHPIRFAAIEGVEHHTTRPASDEGGDYEVLMLHMNIEPGATIGGTFEVVPEPRRPLRQPEPVRFYLDVMARDRAETVYRLRSDRVASASHSATKP